MEMEKRKEKKTGKKKYAFCVEKEAPTKTTKRHRYHKNLYATIPLTNEQSRNAISSPIVGGVGTLEHSLTFDNNSNGNNNSNVHNKRVCVGRHPVVASMAMSVDLNDRKMCFDGSCFINLYWQEY
jgi:hypothetical protein